jgi:uncharacterized membrane protein
MLSPDLICEHDSIYPLRHFKTITMAWLFILLGLVLVLGPVLYLMPTRRDREQAMLRSCARAAGLIVELATLHKVDSEAHERVSASAQPRQPRIQCVRYGLPMGSPLSGLPEIHLVRGRNSDWRADPEYPAVANDGLLLLLQPLLGSLPDSARGLAVTASLVWVYWLESLDGTASGQDRVNQIRLVMVTIRDRVTEWHARRLS